MKTRDFFFNLPKELIARSPVSPRDESRLMVLHRESKRIEHHVFKELPELIDDRYVLVLNKTKVFPARVKVKINDINGELLLIKQINKNIWQCMVKPGKKFTEGVKFIIQGKKNIIDACVSGIHADGTRNIRFDCHGNILDWLEENGLPPFPPYIKNSQAGLEDYQTVYAEKTGSIAAPTAGLHFTQNTFKNFNDKNILHYYLTLHVGRGTFLPVRTENIEDHAMHSEWYEITNETAMHLNAAKKQNKKILAVGTTSVRTLESNYKNNEFLPETNETDIFIYPGYSFNAVDALLTNFHLPESTLIMLVSAFADKAFILKAYNEAVKQKYRFYSFGDAMLIL